VIAGAVVPLVVADRAYDGEAIGDGRQPLHVLGEVHAGDPRRDGLVLARISFGASGFGSNVS
jgi:hypothetical protein